MLILVLGCFGMAQRSKIESASPSVLFETIEESKHGYLRENAIQALDSSDNVDWENTDPSPLIRCVENAQEYSYIRSQCADILAKINHVEAVPSIVEAINQCDDESRYWLLLSLQRLAPSSPLAKGQIAELKHDPDIFISAEAQRWLKEQQ